MQETRVKSILSQKNEKFALEGKLSRSIIFLVENTGELFYAVFWTQPILFGFWM
ncbi:MAG: hypothetical protein U5K54_26945 [Cytophagales bacterium]|nr:hypothetical protein [Cytophagales bacterium]